MKQNFQFLRKCARTRCRKKLNKLIKAAKPEQIRTLSESAKNLLIGNLPMTDAQKRKLSPFKNQIKYLALKRNSISRKKQMLQRGGGHFLIPALASLATTLLSKAFQ